MAKEMLDYLLDANDDLDVSSGDFAVVESTVQHKRQLLWNNKGEFKQSPTVCVGAINFIDDESKQGITREISQQFMRDGMEVRNQQAGANNLADNVARLIDGSFYK
jgi:hypothetical protein